MSAAGEQAEGCTEGKKKLFVITFPPIVAKPQRNDEQFLATV